jgi:hypothetical protein
VVKLEELDIKGNVLFLFARLSTPMISFEYIWLTIPKLAESRNSAESKFKYITAVERL